MNLRNSRIEESCLGSIFQRNTKPKFVADLIIKTCQEFKANPGLWQDVSSQCRLFVEENYSWEKNVETLENLFAGVTAG